MSLLIGNAVSWFCTAHIDKINQGITYHELQELIESKRDVLKSVFQLSENDILTFTQWVSGNIKLTLEEGVSLTDDTCTPWTHDCWRKATETYYWNRYKNLLINRGRSLKYIDDIDKKSDEILDYCGDPRNTELEWHRRGLVIGEVQSGKTALFTGLINKASDAGYKLIIVLTGTIENLRKQTQSRLESDFVGRSSSSSRNLDSVAFNGNGNRWPVCLTSTTKDFSEKTHESRNFSLNSIKEPVLLVVKKNSSVLRQLTEWLESKNQKNGGKIKETLLLIDDEADNASVNTKDSDNPTRINEQIRKLLGLFNNTSYVGFTATPFANVFIDPDVPDELFPANFITCMSVPSSYFSVYKMLDTSRNDDENNKFGNALIAIPPENDSDISRCIPLKHKKDFFPEVPESMKEAVRQFFLVNAIRDLRGDTNSHRSMLINVSRFTDVQNRLKEEIENFVLELKQEIDVCARSPRAESNKAIAALKKTYLSSYVSCGKSWEDILEILRSSVRTVECYVINQSTKDRLNYELHKTTGLRVIAVGGLALSRGYTLEGLCVSYLYRSTAFYDTLMQMGRWFGYRAGYEDLCRIWLPEQTIEYYSQIARATAELKEDIRRMKDSGLTPSNFGLRVRESPDALLITCRNKMRNSDVVFTNVSYNSYFFETPKIQIKNFKKNLENTERLLQNILSCEDVVCCPEKNNKYLFRNVPKEIIASFIKNFRSTPSDFHLMHIDDDNESGLDNFIRNNTISKLQKWDVIFWGSSEKDAVPVKLNPLELGALKRSVKDLYSWNEGLFSCSKSRVAGKEVECFTLSKEQVKQIDDAVKNENSNGKESKIRARYRDARNNPALIILPVMAQHTSENTKETGYLSETPFITFAVSFCHYDEAEECSSHVNKVSYKVNKVMMNQFTAEVDDEDSE